MDVDRSISVATKTGKTKIGINSALKAARTGSAKMIIVASNAPLDMKTDLTYYASLSEIPIFMYDKTSQDLGIVCGRPHLTAFLTIFSAGDSDIMDAVT